MKWTKTSEIPSDDRVVAVRHGDRRRWWFYDHNRAEWRNHADGQCKISAWAVEAAEWLDESESSPSTVWPEEFEITEAYIKIHNGIKGFALWKECVSWLKSYTAGVPEISFPDMKCTCIGEVLQKWGITPLAELVDEIEDVMCSRTALR